MKLYASWRDMSASCISCIGRKSRLISCLHPSLASTCLKAIVRIRPGTIKFIVLLSQGVHLLLPSYVCRRSKIAFVSRLCHRATWYPFHAPPSMGEVVPLSFTLEPTRGSVHTHLQELLRQLGASHAPCSPIAGMS